MLGLFVVLLLYNISMVLVLILHPFDDCGVSVGRIAPKMNPKVVDWTIRSLYVAIAAFSMIVNYLMQNTSIIYG